MTENSSPEPVDLVYLDESSPRPIAVDAKAFARFDAKMDAAVTELLARWELHQRHPLSMQRVTRRAKS